MTDVTLKSFAIEIQTSVDDLIKQFANAGIKKCSNDFITQKEKENLLIYLNHISGIKLNELSLKRKVFSILNISKSDGKNKSVQIEIRKKYICKKYSLKFNKKEQEQMKISPKKINDKDTIKKDKNITKYNNKNINLKSSKLIKNKINNKIKLQNIKEKARLKAEAEKIIRKTEEETYRKIEEKAKQIAKEARKMAKEKNEIWNNSLYPEEEKYIDYHITTSHHAREAEDENDRKIEINRRTKINKSFKKKNNRMFSLKSNYEEIKIFNKNFKNRKKTSILMHKFNKPLHIINKDIIINETISVAELANKMSVKASQIIKIMIKFGIMVTINQIIDQKTAKSIAEEMGHKVILRNENELEKSILSDYNNSKNYGIIKSRPPIVTVMGHVDHGKTLLLDRIKSTNIAEQEFGGITQHIGAYHVIIKNGSITFIDTPGHAAFTAMRARGVKITDIVVLVIAADDGIMPQTIEAIQHANAAKVPLIVAINKIDKQNSDPNKVKNELIQHGILPEEWGGQSQIVYISAKSGKGINKLLEAILLQAELLELKSIHNNLAKGFVIESFLDKNRGPIATILVLDGTLNQGDNILCGFEYGRIRAMYNEYGNEVKSAGPSIPVEILGLSGVPSIGSEVRVIINEKKLKELALFRQNKFREIKLEQKQKSNFKDMSLHILKNKINEINIIIKCDVNGTLEAIVNILESLSTDNIKINIIGSGVGCITETDIALANASKAILLGFNIRADSTIKNILELENIDLRYYSIIYDLIDDVKKLISGSISTKYEQKIIGLSKVKSVFNSIKFGCIAGCIVTKGIVKRNNKIHILRNNKIIFKGKLESLRRFKEDVDEVSNGIECGIKIKNFNDIKIGDIICILKI